LPPPWPSRTGRCSGTCEPTTTWSWHGGRLALLLPSERPVPRQRPGQPAPEPGHRGPRTRLVGLRSGESPALGPSVPNQRPAAGSMWVPRVDGASLAPGPGWWQPAQRRRRVPLVARREPLRPRVGGASSPEPTPRGRRRWQACRPGTSTKPRCSRCHCGRPLSGRRGAAAREGLRGPPSPRSPSW